MPDVPEIKIKKLFEDTIIPERAHATDSGIDLFACKFEKIYRRGDDFGGSINENFTNLDIPPGGRALINTGISATVGPGYEIQIRPRSGLALKNGLTVLNTPGTIDEAYRGPICVIIINHSGMTQTIKKGSKIAQMVVCPVTLNNISIVPDLDDTERNANGFGSTGD
jgi:dUTP pyrophosphatase